MADLDLMDRPKDPNKTYYRIRLNRQFLWIVILFFGRIAHWIAGTSIPSLAIGFLILILYAILLVGVLQFLEIPEILRKIMVLFLFSFFIFICFPRYEKWRDARSQKLMDSIVLRKNKTD